MAGCCLIGNNESNFVEIENIREPISFEKFHHYRVMEIKIIKDF